MRYIEPGHAGLEVPPICIATMSCGEPEHGHPQMW